MKHKTLTLVEDDYIPPIIAPGNIYLSKPLMVCIHLCPCGCGGHVPLVLNREGRDYVIHNEGISLHPEVSNDHLECKSQYNIIKGKVISIT